MLTQSLNNVTGGIANAIVNYREENPFNTIEEIKFVHGFSKELFESNKQLLAVCTNINYADEDELFSLGHITEDEVEDILSYRRKHSKIASISDLKNEKLIADNRYKKIKDYIATYDKTKIDVTENSHVVNVSTANQSQLVSTGLSTNTAQKIIDYRKNGYTYKTLTELTKIPGLGFTTDQVNEFEDNLNTKTDINEASDNEMQSVFGNEATKVIYKRNYTAPSEVSEYLTTEKYNKLKNVIYTGVDDSECININTATRAQLSEMGFSPTIISSLAGVKNMKTAADIPCDLGEHDKNASLYTNINTASVKELKSLNHGITDGIINEIISYREEQPFGTVEEMKTFFNDRNYFSFYNSVSEYLVVR